MRRRRIDPLARQAILQIAAGRIAIGVAAVAATGPALRAIGFAAEDGSARTLARVAGCRDVALGLLTLAVRNDRARLRAVGLTAAGVDAADVVTFAIAARDPALRRGGIGSSLTGAAGAVIGAWAWHQLGDR
jgi:hypothetical protein